MSPELLSGIRSILLVVGGSLVGAGYIDESDLHALVGAVLSILAAVWGILAKRPQSKEAKKIANSVNKEVS